MTGESNELLNKFQRREQLQEGQAEPTQREVGKSIYSRYPSLTRKQLKELQTFFNKYDSGKQGFLGQQDLQHMFEEMGNALTYLELKGMIEEADKDGDKKVDLIEFIDMILKVSTDYEAVCADSPWLKLAQLPEIDITVEGVGGAKNFFEAKSTALSKTNKFEEEIKKEREERKVLEEEKKQKRNEFKNLRANFQ